MTIREMANDSEMGFTTEERAWSLRAAEGIVKVGEWLREVEGWTLAWGRGKGEGYLPPEPGKKKKKERQKSILRMDDITEEDEDSPLRRGQPPSPSPAGGSPAGVILGGETPRTNRAGKPLTPMQLKMQRKAVAAMMEDGGQPVATPPRQETSRSIPVEPLSIKTNGSFTPSTPVHRHKQIHKEEPEDDEDEYEDVDDNEEYFGSLPKSTIEKYEVRIEQITDEVEELDVEGLKGKVLCMNPGPPPGRMSNTFKHTEQELITPSLRPLLSSQPLPFSSSHLYTA